MPTDLRRTVGWMIAVRALISVLLLGGATVAQVRSPGLVAIDPFFFLIAVTFALTISYAATLRYVDRLRWLLDAQVACDAVTVSAFIHVTGGVTSFFSTLYALPIVAASVVQFRRGAILAATLSGLLYVALVLMQYQAEHLPWASWLMVYGNSNLPSSGVAQYIVGLNLFSFFLVALLSGSMADTAQSAGQRLRRASSEIADLQTLNQNVIDSLPSGLITTDPDQRVLTFNNAAERICGVPVQAVVGRQLTGVLQLPAEVVETLNGLGSSAARRLEFKFVRPDGRAIDMGLSATHLRTPGGRAGFLITFQDLTDVKKLERDARLQQRLAAVGEMAAGIAHEIRNPLASMSGSIQILRDELPLSEEQGQLMDIVLRESDRLNTTIRSFLEYARPHRFVIARIDLRRAVQDTALLLRNGADVRDTHVIDVELATEPVWFEADENQIKQILWNLATNGLRAMPNGGRLRLGASASSVDAVLQVTDEGIGIEPEALEGLFQPFHGSFAKGSGLGLAIVHRIVTDYQGEIRVDSTPGAGTTVSVRLPARAEVTT